MKRLVAVIKRLAGREERYGEWLDGTRAASKVAPMPEGARAYWIDEIAYHLEKARAAAAMSRIAEARAQ